MMTVTEANDVNVLLNYALALDTTTSDDKAREAAERLADRAHARLHAGLDSARVRAAWPEVE